MHRKLPSLSQILRWLNTDLFRRLTKNVGVLYSGTAAASVLGLVSLPLSVNLLGAELFGYFVLIQWYQRMFDSLVNFQSWQVVIKYGAEAKEQGDSERLKRYVKAGFIIDSVSAFAGALLALLLADFVGGLLGWDQLTINLARIYSAGIVVRLSGTSEGLLRLFGRFNLFAIQSVLGSALKLVGILGLWIFNVRGSLLAYVLVILVSETLRHVFLVIVAVLYLRREGYKGWTRVSVRRTGHFLRFAFWTNIQRTVHIPIQEFDKILVSQIISVEAVAVYQVFKQFGTVLSKVTTPIYQTVFPELSTMIAQGNVRTAAKTTAKVSIIFMTLAAIPVLLVGGTSFWWLELFFGEIFAAYWIVFIAYLLIRTAASAASPIDPLFISLGYVRTKFLISLGVSVVYVAAGWLLCTYFDLAGMVASYGLQHVLIYGLMVFVMATRGELKDRPAT